MMEGLVEIKQLLFKKLCLILDSTLPFTRKAYFHLWNIHHLHFPSTLILLPYWSLLAGILVTPFCFDSHKKLCKLPLVLNSASRIITQTFSFHHTHTQATSLATHHLLDHQQNPPSVQPSHSLHMFQVSFKSPLLLAPSRSSSLQVVIPTTCLITMGTRALSHSVLQLLNPSPDYGLTSSLHLQLRNTYFQTSLLVLISMHWFRERLLINKLYYYFNSAETE